MDHLFDVPPERRTLSAVLGDRADEHPDAEFLTVGERVWTYGQFHAWSTRIAAGLQSLGVAPGDRVLLMLPNCAEFVAVWLACAQIGAVEVPVNTAYKGMVLEHVVGNSGARVAVVAGEFLDRFAPFPALQHVVVWNRLKSNNPGANVVDWLHLEEERRVQRPEVRHTDQMAILYSSGTTGLSKGIMLSHNYFWFSGMRSAAHGRVQQADRLYTCLPLFHANAQALTVMSALVSGASVILDSRFSASRFWDRLRAVRASRFNYIGGMIPILMKQPVTDIDRRHGVEFALGAAAPADQFLEFEDRFGVTLIESYGQTENCVALANPVDDRRIGSVGKAICGYDVALVDDEDEPVPVGQTGELVFRPRYPNIMMDGYHAMPEATLAASRNLWFHSGDLLRRDADDYFYYVDRKKDAIRRRGENISAYEVELVVNAHPEVAESAAIAVPSEVGEDEVMVFVVVKPGAQLSQLDLITHCDGRMPYFAVPRYVEFRDELPKTPTHRIEKYRLRQEGLSADTWDRERSGFELTR
ncbi:MAG: AMP-binding protein [Mycobacterium sp.]